MAWLVGGCVRDHLMGLPVKDWDVEVHRLEVDDLERLLRRFGKVNAVGRSFGVLKLRPRGSPSTDPEIDVSLPRRDSNSGPGHRGIEVEGDPWMPLDEAVRRRDLTINALLVDLRNGQLEDRVGGLEDLQQGRLRAVDHDTFLDDPLRTLRVVQFVARTGFSVDAELLELCRQANLHELPAERIQLEWGKLLLKGCHFVHALDFAVQADLTQRVFHEWTPTPGEVLERAIPLRAELDSPRRWALMLALWMDGHDTAAIEALLDRMWIFKVGRMNVRRAVHALVAHAGDPMGDDTALRHLAVHVELDLALRQRAALHPDQDWSAPRQRAETLGILHDKLPTLILGRDFAALGVEPGPEMGEWVRRGYQAQLDGVYETREDGLAWAAAQVKS